LSIRHYTTLSLLLKLSLWYNRLVSEDNVREANMQHRLPHVGLNAQLLSLAPSYRSAGINRYIYNVLVNLAKQEGSHRFTAFLSDKNFPCTGHLHQQLSRLPTVKPPVRIFWEQFVQPWILWRQGFDLLHSMAFVVPLWSPCPSLVTVYDLSFLRYPENFRMGNRLYLSQVMRFSASRANHFIAISEHTARDMVRFLGIEPDRISVIHCGVEKHFHPLPSHRIEQFRREKGLPERMILYLGTIEPRKNIGSLIKAYHGLLETWTGPAPGGSRPGLVIAGGKGWGCEEVFALVEKLELGDQVMFPGFVPDKELPLWYNAAECFAYPSLYEGFGLPALEAMACGTPVITSNSSSLPEVVGQAGLTVMAEDVEELADALRRMLTDSDLQDRLRQQGVQRAARFSWEETTRQTLMVYDQVLGHGG
jgi:glycosyltransferase involved in cell wall biosynthesis